MHVAVDAWKQWLSEAGGGKATRRDRPNLLDSICLEGWREVLLASSGDDLNTIPTVILTTSESEADIVKSYQLRANCYLTKPVQLNAFENLVKSINDFWLTKAKLPQQRQR